MATLFSRLPPLAKAKLAAIEMAANERQTLIFGITRRLSDMRTAAGNSDGADADAIGAEIQKLLVVQERHQLHLNSLMQVVAQVRGFLENVPATSVIEDGPPRKHLHLRRGETYLKASQRVSDELAHVHAERRDVTNAGVPVADLKAAVKDTVKALAARGRPSLTTSHEGVEVSFSKGGFTPTSDVAAILAWMDPKAMEKRLCDEVDALPTPAVVMSRAARADRLAVLADYAWDLECEAEAIVEAAAAEGHELLRRPFADSAAVLNIRIKRQGSAAAA